MMLSELAQTLNTIFPTRYSHFTTKQQVPFICYLDMGDENFHADDNVFVEGTLVSIELYTDKKDLAAERKIKDLFKQNEIPYERDGTIFIESESLFLTSFTIKLIN